MYMLLLHHLNLNLLTCSFLQFSSTVSSNTLQYIVYLLRKWINVYPGSVFTLWHFLLFFCLYALTFSFFFCDSTHRPTKLSRESHFLKEKESWLLNCYNLKECHQRTCAVTFLVMSFTRGVGVGWAWLAACLEWYILVFTNSAIFARIAINKLTSWTISCLTKKVDDSNTKNKKCKC